MVVDLTAGIKCAHLHQITAERRPVQAMEVIVEGMNTAVVETNIIEMVTEAIAKETMVMIVTSTTVETSIIVMATSTTVTDMSIIGRTSTTKMTVATMSEAVKPPTTNP